jgi:hypothetical protein
MGQSICIRHHQFGCQWKPRACAPIVFWFKNRPSSPPPQTIPTSINHRGSNSSGGGVRWHRHRGLFIRLAPTQYSILNNSPPVYYKYTRRLATVLQTVAADLTVNHYAGEVERSRRRPTPRIHLFIFLLASSSSLRLLVLLLMLPPPPPPPLQSRDSSRMPDSDEHHLEGLFLGISTQDVVCASSRHLPSSF